MQKMYIYSLRISDFCHLVCHHGYGKTGVIRGYIMDFRQKEKSSERLKFQGFLLVGETGFEPAAT